MLTKDSLIDYLASSDLSQRDKILLILLTRDGDCLSAVEIVETALAHGLRGVEGWNLSRILKHQLKGYAVRLPAGWILTPSGRQYVQEKFLPNDPASTKETAQNLRNQLDKISNPYTRAFVEEAIKCLEYGLLRSAVVMSWVGAISVLYDYVLADKQRLSQFNQRASIKVKDWKQASSRGDLALMKESTFLDVLAELSVLDRNTKEHLKNVNLNQRNACGHPSPMKIGEENVKAHIEFLILNIYAEKRFGETEPTN